MNVRLSLCGASSDVADAVFASHSAAVSDFDLQTADLFGELDALGVVERPTDVVQVGYL